MRIKSKVEFFRESETVEALHLEGKMLTIFLLWIFSLSISYVIFLYEEFCGRCVLGKCVQLRELS